MPLNLLWVSKMDYCIYRKQVYDIIGAAMEVHNELGFGLSENIYQEALSMELRNRGINNVREQELPVYYKGQKLSHNFKTDIMAGDIIVELKSVATLHPEHRAQLCNYLRIARYPIGLLINFGSPLLQGERWVCDLDTNDCYVVDKNMQRVIDDINEDY